MGDQLSGVGKKQDQIVIKLEPSKIPKSCHFIFSNSSPSPNLRYSGEVIDEINQASSYSTPDL